MKNNKNGGFFAGRGFYAALAVCLLGAVAAAWVTVDRTITSINEQTDIPQSENRVIAEEKYSSSDSAFAAEDVGKPKEDVKIDEPKTSEEDTSTFHFGSKGLSFSMPVDGGIIGSHSGGELVKYDAIDEWRTHDGIDIACDVGTEVKAAAEGEVTAVKNDPLWGTVVEIRHEGNIITVYSGLSPEVSVKPGDKVKAGDVIGTLGETNLAEVNMDSHLHFSMKENGKFIDPKTKIK